MTTCLDYFRTKILSVTTVDADGEMIELNDVGVQDVFDSFEGILDQHTGLGDGSTYGSILAEMPVDSNCGDSCTRAIDQAATLISSIRLAFGFDKPEFLDNVASAAVECCLCFIRG